jgi:hypothetical protein
MTPRRKVLHENRIFARLVKEYPTVYRIRRHSVIYVSPMSARQFPELTFRTSFTSIQCDLCVPQPFRTWSDNNIWLRVQIVKLLITKFAPACFHFHSLHSKDWKSMLGTLSDTLKLFKLPRFSRGGRNHEDGITFLWNAGINFKHSVVSKTKTLQYNP